jgi:hypothetical protein
MTGQRLLPNTLLFNYSKYRKEQKKILLHISVSTESVVLKYSFDGGKITHKRAKLNMYFSTDKNETKPTEGTHL